MCLLNSHFTRGAASSLGQREAREGTGQARLQRAPLLCQIIQPMKKEGEVQSQAGAWGTRPASPALALELSVSQGVRYFLWTQCPLGTELPITAGTSRSLPPQEQVTGWEQRPVCPDTALLCCTSSLRASLCLLSDSEPRVKSSTGIKNRHKDKGE